MIARVNQLHFQPWLERGRSLEEAHGQGRTVGFRQYDYRAHSRLPRENKVAFDARDIEILVARRDDEKCINVCRDKLKAAVVARSRSFEKARPNENAHEVLAFSVNQQPVAYGRSVFWSLRRGEAGRD
jgi:hypothetical protein